MIFPIVRLPTRAE